MTFILEYLAAYAKRAFRLLADFLLDNLQNSVDREIKPKLQSQNHNQIKQTALKFSLVLEQVFNKQTVCKIFNLSHSQGTLLLLNHPLHLKWLALLRRTTSFPRTKRTPKPYRKLVSYTSLKGLDISVFVFWLHVVSGCVRFQLFSPLTAACITTFCG